MIYSISAIYKKYSHYSEKKNNGNKNNKKNIFNKNERRCRDVKTQKACKQDWEVQLFVFYSSVSTFVAFYTSDFVSYVSFPTLFACFLGFGIPTSFVFIENVFYYSLIYMCLWPLTRLCVIYVVKEVTSFWGLGQLMGMACKRKLCRLRRNWN